MVKALYDGRLATNIAGLKMKTPITTASGTFGFGLEFTDFLDLEKVGAVTVKGTSLEPQPGNKGQRAVETPSGMLNSIGLENPGVDYFLETTLPQLRQYDVPVIVNIYAHSYEDYGKVAKKLDVEGVDALEINISCPNVKEDIDRQKPVLGNVIGGLSGPAVRPVAVRMCYQVAQNVHVPIIGMGGIMTAEDAIEFFLAGASAVAVGTVNFTNPCIAETISHGILEYMDKHGIKKLKDMIGLALPEGKIHLKRAVKR